MVSELSEKFTCQANLPEDAHQVREDTTFHVKPCGAEAVGQFQLLGEAKWLCKDHRDFYAYAGMLS